MGVRWPGDVTSVRAVTRTDHENLVQVRRAYKFLLRPTAHQWAAMEACLEDHRQLYNAALEERREAWQMRKGPRQLLPSVNPAS